MPVVQFDVLWPDSTVMTCESPSTVIRSFIVEGQAYSLPEFLKITELGLMQASERVREKYGFACSAATQQLMLIQAKSKEFPETSSAVVRVLRLE